MLQFSVERLDEQAKSLIDDAHRFANEHELFIEDDPYSYEALVFAGLQKHSKMTDAQLHRIVQSINWMHVSHEIRAICSMIDEAPGGGEQDEAVDQILNDYSLPRLMQVTTFSVYHGMASDMESDEKGRLLEKCTEISKMFGGTEALARSFTAYMGIFAIVQKQTGHAEAASVRPMPRTPRTAPDPETIRAHRERVASATDLWSALEAMRPAGPELNAALTEDDLAIVLAGLPEILATPSDTRENHRNVTIAKIQIPGIPGIVLRPEVRDFVVKSYNMRCYLRWMATLPEEERVGALGAIAEYEPGIAWSVWTHTRELPGVGRAGLGPLLTSDDPGVKDLAMRASADPLGNLPEPNRRRRE